MKKILNFVNDWWPIVCMLGAIVLIYYLSITL